MSLSCEESQSYTKHEAKRLIIKRECSTVANSIRNITIASSKCKVQLSNMAAEFIVGIDYGIYCLNTAIPNIVTEEAKDILVITTQSITKYANEIQQVMHGNSEDLKEKLALILEKIGTGSVWFGENFKIPSNFASIQLKRKNDFFIHALYKLKFQATLFQKTNLELENETNTALAICIKTFNSLVFYDKDTTEELRRLLHHLSVVIERAVYKLGNWVEVNENDTENVKMVNDISNQLSELYSKGNGCDNGSYLKDRLLSNYGTATKQIVKLVQIQYYDQLGGQEFIRSVLFDAIAIGYAYSDNLKSFMSQA